MTIEEQVKQIIKDRLAVDLEALEDSASFTNDLGADSLDIVELVMEFEDKFEIDIPDEKAEKIETVKDAIDYIKERVNSSES